MNDASSKLAAFLAELRRRRVFRVAVVYAGVAFIVIQIIDGAFDYLRIPEWIGSLIIIMLAVGFPIAVGMAWAFDLTAEGLVRAKVKREPTAAKAPHNPIVGNKTLAAIAVLAILAAVWSWWGRPGPEAEVVVETGLGERSIAVLPFINMSADQEQEYFCDGITDDILTHLSKIGELKVIGRTSVMQYKNTTKRLRDIGEELGVATLLEGSVRRADSRVRITSQLVDAETEEHLWAETYDRDLTDIFAIQTDVAQKIAAALKATLTPAEKGYIEQKPTDNPEAYDYYLKGNASFYRIWLDGYKISLDVAIPMYEKAIDLDPDFALAYARLAQAHLRMRSGGGDKSPERIAKAKSALDRALALDPNHPEVHMAHGYYYYHGFKDWESALEQAELGLKGQPNNAEIIDLIGIIKRRQGKWEAAAAALKKAAELDPRHVDYVQMVSYTNMLMRNWAEAERYADQVILIWPEFPNGYYLKAFVYLSSKGDIEKARGVMRESLKKVDPGLLADWHSSIEILARDYRKALDILEAANAGSFIKKANIYRYLGRPERAAAYYDSARITYEERVRKNPGDYTAHSDLGIAYAGLGRREDAIREGELAVEILPLSRDAFFVVRNGILDLAKIYTMLGEQDEAIDQIEILLSVPSGITVPLLKIDPRWDPLREHPRFQALVAKYGGK